MLVVQLSITALLHVCHNESRDILQVIIEDLTFVNYLFFTWIFHSVIPKNMPCLSAEMLS